jgi:hypothetical protein
VSPPNARITYERTAAEVTWQTRERVADDLMEAIRALREPPAAPVTRRGLMRVTWSQLQSHSG